MKPGERISVVIPAHNGLPDLLQAVQSVLNQTEQPHELIVVDDASVDGGGEAVVQRFGDAVQVLTGHFGSASAARNAGWRAANGEWIAFLDADDVWFPEKLRVASELLRAAPHADWFFSDGEFLTLDGQLHDSWFGLYADITEPYCGSPLAQLFEVNFVLTSSTVVRRSALEANHGFDETLTHAEDLDLWVKLSRRGSATASGRPLLRYQHREGGLSRQTENRLSGGAKLFDRLSVDAALTPALRRLALRRASMYHFKLALHALRQGKQAQARDRFRRSWLFPDRVKPVLFGYAAACIPAAWFAGLRRHSAARAVAKPLAALRRVNLQESASHSPVSGSAAEGGRT
ncbi:MAG: glycosyltransferase family A protein [Candidatus Eisenbacteria bacterium]